MTAVTKSTRGADGVLTTLTYELPSQTTPFAPSRQQGGQGTGMPDQCSISVLCRGLSYAAYSSRTAAHDPHPLAGQVCLGVQPTSTAAGGGGWDGVGFEEACWPTNYFALFDDEWALLDGGPRAKTGATSGRAGDAPTAAFPGDRCLAGWTTACTTTVTAGASPLQAFFPQAWCCPPGAWTCATGTADGDGGGDGLAPQRLCRSLVNVGASPSPTEIWMSWDPPFQLSSTLGSWSEAFTWKAPVPGETDPARAATVFRKVFPLALSSGGASGVAGEAVMAETVAVAVAVTEMEMEVARPTGVAGRSLFGDEPSRGAVAGFLGAAVATVAVSLLGFALWRRARRRDGMNGGTAAVREDGKYEAEVLLKPEEVKLA
ncbi:hypothetical protein F4818DRAFT_39703 [Hypoxylon cercidicola]|nr:hypothetical protein F4818DRAFT_39703 [Hypoxylon cercidicola]